VGVELGRKKYLLDTLDFLFYFVNNEPMNLQENLDEPPENRNEGIPSGFAR
jgi:hypothetical protein